MSRCVCFRLRDNFSLEGIPRFPAMEKVAAYFAWPHRSFWVCSPPLLLGWLECLFLTML
jgi:hypothetical protein